MAKTEKGPELVSSLLKQQPLGLRLPEELRYTRRAGIVCKDADKEEVLCKTELDFFDEEAALKMGLPSGTRAAVHKCVREGSTEGEYVPVKDEREAMQVAKDFCGCVKKRLVETRVKCSRRGA